jgi:hypothetical protein
MEPINTMDHASTALKIVLSAFPQHYALNARILFTLTHFCNSVYNVLQ